MDKRQEIDGLAILLERFRKYCVYQERCSNDIMIYAAKLKLNSVMKTKILKVLIAEGFVNDNRFSTTFARGKFNSNGWGKIKIRAELQKRKFDRSSIDKALDSLDPTAYYDKMIYLVKKKFNSINKEDPGSIRYAILMRYLLSKGFESDLSRSAIKEVLIGDYEDEN